MSDAIATYSFLPWLRQGIANQITAGVTDHGRAVMSVQLQLHGDAALISPELLMKIRARDARILQRPVRHYPRVHGEQTGAKLSVILISLLGLVRSRPVSGRHSWQAALPECANRRRALNLGHPIVDNLNGTYVPVEEPSTAS